MCCVCLHADLFVQLMKVCYACLFGMICVSRIGLIYVKKRRWKREGQYCKQVAWERYRGRLKGVRVDAKIRSRNFGVWEGNVAH
jgi:hypothetical protein